MCILTMQYTMFLIEFSEFDVYIVILCIIECDVGKTRLKVLGEIIYGYRYFK